MEILRARHSYPEKKGFVLSRPNGCSDYVFIHFHTPVKIDFFGDEKSFLPNTVIIYDTDFPQRFISDECDLIHDWAHIGGNISDILGKYKILPNTPYTLDNSYFITNIMMQIESELSGGALHSENICSLLFEELLARISRSIYHGSSGSEEISSDTARLLSEVRMFAFSNISNRITVSDMAKKASLSPSRFHYLYKTFFGISPAKDLINARIDNAKFYLSHNKYSISEVAALSGYNDVCHFIRQFKAVTGVTPKKFIF